MIKLSLWLFLYTQLPLAFYLHNMDFYKLNNFQLYSIINSRHLDTEDKASAMREFDHRGLPEEEVQKLAQELAEKTKIIPSSFGAISPNVWLLIGAIVLLILLKQCVVH